MNNSCLQFRRAAPSDYPGILELQRRNFIGNLDQDRARDGFLSIEYSAEQFAEINADLGVVVAVRGAEVLGYLCGTTFAYGRRFPILDAVITGLDGKRLAGKALTPDNTFLYGPVCIDRPVRGSGVLDGLFAGLKDIVGSRHEFCALFISDKNPRSLAAHLGKLGMTRLATFEFDAKLFHLLSAALR